MPGIGHDTKYLQELVGEALARGCAACIAAQPNDPVDYLGQWLLRFVKNAEIEGKFYEQKEKELEAKKAKLEEEQAAAQQAKQAEQHRQAAIESLATMQAEPRSLIQHALDLIKQHTGVGAAYAAMVSEPEEPDWMAPEDPEDPAAAESEDEADPVATPEAEAGAEGGEAAAEGAEAAAADATDAPAEDGAEGAPPKVQRPVDYSKKYLSYMAATAGQEFMLTTELTRPGPTPEDAGEDYKPEPTALTFRVLDERVPMVYSGNVAFENNVKFFRDFPKIGAYQACGIQVPPSGEFKAVIAADTLFPEGSGQPLSQADQDFIWEVSLALSKAYEAQEAKFKTSQEGKSAKEAIDALKKKIKEIYVPPVVESEEGAEPAAAPAAPPEEPEAAPADELPPPEGDDVDPVALLSYEVKKLARDLLASNAAKEASSKALDLAQQSHTVLCESLASSSAAAVARLRNAAVVPQATFHAIKAVLHLLGKQPESFRNWKRAFEHFSASTFQELAQYDAAQERKADVWKRVRQAYKGVKDPAMLATEMPETHLGVLLTMYIKQVRKVGRRAEAFRGHSKASEQLTAELETKTVALAEAEQKKAEAEEAARKLAAEEEARAAAEAAAAGEGDGAEAAADEEAE